MPKPVHDWRGQTSDHRAVFVCAACGALAYTARAYLAPGLCPGAVVTGRERYVLPPRPVEGNAASHEG